ncbi:MAG TPA: NAD(P)-dependent oxidoreductase [Burkholderiaceae bacterium]|nr:NAD(P)-dependent oxidoreductase [Burkholderiaceae bacterium]
MSLFKAGLTRDLLTSAGQPSFGTAPLEILAAAKDVLQWEYLAESLTEVTPDLAARYDALYVNSPKVTAGSVARSDCRVKLIARHGVGYDSVDVPAMTRAGVLVTNTPIAVRRPVATMAITYVLALAQKMLVKDRLTRSGNWTQRNEHMGRGLTGKTLGIVGAGGTGQELLRVVKGFDMRLLAADPYADAGRIEALGATLVPLPTLLREADFVVLMCLLNDETRHLIDAEKLALMRPTAYLINVARGPVVDEPALIRALEAKRIAGAGLDVFEQEPIAPDNPLLKMEQVIVSPHALCWTDECFNAIATDGLTSLVDVARGKRPAYLVNPDALKAARWAHLR